MIIRDSMWHDGVLESVVIDTSPEGKKLNIVVRLYPEPINARERNRYLVTVTELINFAVEGNMEEIIDNANAGNIDSGNMSNSEITISLYGGSVSARGKISANEL